MELIDWNVQWGRGVDGHLDLGRIVNIIMDTADVDVICLQEIARGFGDMPGNPGDDQLAELAHLLPGYQVLFAPGVDRRGTDGKERQFGNVVATRLPILEVFRRTLPWPADPSVASMPRVALEVTVLEAGVPLRIICTHLEFYSASQRLAQVDAIRGWHAEACQQAAHPGRDEKRPGPFALAPRPASAILCGDFNCKTDSEAYARMLSPFDDNSNPWLDTWRIAHPDAPHAPTCGIFDKVQWPEPAFACDFIFATADLRPRIAGMRVDTSTQASDHQPLHLTLDAAG